MTSFSRRLIDVIPTTRKLYKYLRPLFGYILDVLSTHFSWRLFQDVLSTSFLRPENATIFMAIIWKYPWRHADSFLMTFFPRRLIYVVRGKWYKYLWPLFGNILDVISTHFTRRIILTSLLRLEKVISVIAFTCKTHLQVLFYLLQNEQWNHSNLVNISKRFNIVWIKR